VLWLSIVLVISAIVVTGYFIVKARPKPDRLESYPYIRNESLFSSAERRFLGVLESVIGDRYRVFCRTRVVDVAGMKKL